MNNIRTYGGSPFSVAVVHGGPGAGGEMAPVARRLARGWGVLEPIQTETTLTGQVEELRALVERYGDLPLTLIGHSWGAWLSFIVAARHPAYVKKLLLVSSGPFEERYADHIHDTRLSRLSREDRTAFDSIIAALSCPLSENQDALLAQLGKLAARADAYDPLEDVSAEADAVGPRADIFQPVWNAAAEMRRNGQLLELAGRIQCPVVAVHGDYDPHPAQGVESPLAATLKDFRFVLLRNCGHTPWLERQARDEFYRVLEEELS